MERDIVLGSMLILTFGYLNLHLNLNTQVFLLSAPTKNKSFGLAAQCLSNCHWYSGTSWSYCLTRHKSSREENRLQCKVTKQHFIRHKGEAKYFRKKTLAEELSI